MKNKVLVVLFLSLCCLPFMLQAQWEKCAEQKDILVGKDYYGDGGVNNIAHYKNTTLIATYIDDVFTIYYSNDRGRHWNKLKMPINKTIKGNYPSGSYQNNLIAINQLGIFYSTRKYLTNLSGGDRQIVSHTKDLGVTWTMDTLPGGLISTDSNMYLITDKLFPYTPINLYLPKLQQLYKYNPSDGQWKLYYDFNLTQDQDPNQFLNISKNRIAYSTTDSILIRDEATKELLIKFAKKGTASPSSNLGKIGTDINCFAVDSMVVYYYSKADKFFIDVSKDLGRTWMSSLVDLPHIVLSDCNPSISIENNKIYVSGDKQILVSTDFGRTWQPILNQLFKKDKLISRFVVADSLLLVRHDSKLFTRKTNEINWTYSNNTFSDFFDLIKINDALIWATGRANQHLTSSNYGKTWQVIRPDDTLLLNNYTFLGKDGIIYTQNGLKSNDMGNTWKVSPIPAFSMYQIVGDTIFIAAQAGGGIFYSPKAPYQVWTAVNRDYSTNISDWIARFYYHNGVIYYGTLASNFGLKRSKLDGTRLPDILLEENIGKLIVDKNKIYFTYPLNILKVAFTNDNGLTWQKYTLPNYDPKSLFRTDSFLLASTVVPKQCGKLTTTTGGVYMSADDGKSWFLFSEGIQPECTSFRASFYRIDSFVFAQSDYGLWRTNIANLRLKSISGAVYVDKNRNGIKNTDEQGVYNARVFLSKTGAFTTTDSLGNYSFVVDLKETDTLRASWDNPFATYSPAYLLVNQSDTVKNLGIYLPENIKDLAVTVTAFSPPRGGFNNTYLLTYTNKGTIIRNGKVTYQYASEQTFIEARPVPTSHINKTLSWDFQNLKSGESRNINLTFKTNVNVQRGSRITNIATIEPIVDDTLKTNNIDTLIQTVVGSYDPNDKQVSFLNNNRTPSVIDTNLDLIYTIRFQNTGNYQADFVRVVDTLSDKLDITTLRVLASSHNYTLTVKNKNILLLDFNPIYLPDSTTSEKESHGFIKFSIKPKRVLSTTEIIKNTAYIYFDYNEAIITNTVETPSRPNGLRTPSVSEAILVFPNPSNGSISFQSDRFKGKNLAISIYSIEGKLIYTLSKKDDDMNTINAENLREGTYILQVRTDNELFIGKFIVVN
jgi:photosystem II stability/assembly factor-like uncharacterized protein